MMTLKDIKVSKNRIPVQNALWLRPMGGLSFKLYYPHGGDWAEVFTQGGGGDNPEYDKDIKDMKKEISAIKEDIKGIDSKIKSLGDYTVEIRKELNTVVTKLPGIELDIQTLFDNITITTLKLDGTLPPNGTFFWDEYGVGSTEVEKMITDKTITKATMEGYEGEFDVTIEGDTIPQVTMILILVENDIEYKYVITYVKGPNARGKQSWRPFSTLYTRDVSSTTLVLTQNLLEGDRSKSLTTNEFLALGFPLNFFEEAAENHITQIMMPGVSYVFNQDYAYMNPTDLDEAEFIGIPDGSENEIRLYLTHNNIEHQDEPYSYSISESEE